MIAASFHGLILALGLILPLGAQNVFVFNQGALQSKLKGAIPVILTASLCDTFLILLAVLGVSVVVLTIPLFQMILFSVGIIFLLYMGFAIWKSEPANSSEQQLALTPKKQIFFAMSVSLLNPHAILDTIGVIGTSSLAYEGAVKWAFTISCIAVSWIWFLGLAICGKMIGKLDQTGKFLKTINKISACIIWFVAIYLIFKLFE